METKAPLAKAGSTAPVRRLDGWGFEGETLAPSAALLAWLAEKLGPPGPGLRAARELPAVGPARSVGKLAGVASSDPRDRLAHARGAGLPDVVRLRAGMVPALPDAVVRPGDGGEVASLLATASARGFTVIPRGGGTSVTGGVNVLPAPAPVVVLELERLARLVDLDPRSHLATFEAGITGLALEAALAARGFTLGHYPQSFELSTLGGWVATRSSGQQSLGYGRIDDLVAGLELMAPAGALTLRPEPGSAAGPDLRRLVLGSEGRMGVITRATVRIRPRPETLRVEGALFPDLDRGLEAVRALAQARVPLCLLRLSDPAETAVALTVGLGATPAAFLVRPYLRLRGIGPDACLLLLGADGTRADVGRHLGRARDRIRQSGAVMLGQGPGHAWQRDRFRHPYLREALLETGYATDTLETATTWARLPALRARMTAALAGALSTEGERVAVLSHLSHVYPDGASLYFTFFFRTHAPDVLLERWGTIKRAANRTLVEQGATASHHHGIGQWHASMYEAEVGPLGRGLVAGAAATLDPAGILNPHVLLDPTERLGV